MHVHMNMIEYEHEYHSYGDMNPWPSQKGLLQDLLASTVRDMTPLLTVQLKTGLHVRMCNELYSPLAPVACYSWSEVFLIIYHAPQRITTKCHTSFTLVVDLVLAGE